MFLNIVAKHGESFLHSNRLTSTFKSLRRRSEVVTCSKLLDAFKVLNVERKFDVPPEALKQSYRTQMANLHPDKHHGKPLAEQEVLRKKATEVTRSYQILKQASARATHMLQLLGKIQDIDESSMGEILETAEGRMLLMEVMEIREVIEDADSDEKLEPLLQENAGKIDAVCNQLADAFASHDLDQALQLTVALQYYSRIEETIRGKMNER